MWYRWYDDVCTTTRYAQVWSESANQELNHEHLNSGTVSEVPHVITYERVDQRYTRTAATDFEQLLHRDQTVETKIERAGDGTREAGSGNNRMKRMWKHRSKKWPKRVIYRFSLDSCSLSGKIRILPLIRFSVTVKSFLRIRTIGYYLAIRPRKRLLHPHQIKPKKGNPNHFPFYDIYLDKAIATSVNDIYSKFMPVIESELSEKRFQFYGLLLALIGENLGQYRRVKVFCAIILSFQFVANI